MTVLSVEKTCGIEVFLIQPKGIGGKLRTTPEDFIVIEKSNYPPKNENGRFVISDITSKSWETHRLASEISKQLHISRKRVGFAGTKDKRAVTTQLMSIYNTPIEKLDKVRLKDVSIDNSYRSDRPIKIGNLHGNSFKINIRNIDKEIKNKDLNQLFSSIKNHGGFPNFFGIQRFGIIRPISHIVGRYIVKEEFEKAVMCYIANPIKGEDEETYKLREKLQKTYDFSAALKTYPKTLNYENAMLNHLVNNPDDFIGALMQLPKNLLTMFVYAYQSYLFNQILSERIKQNLPLNKAIIGDIILPVRKGIIEVKGIIVTKQNLDKANIQLAKNKAYISGLLFGSDTDFTNGEIEHKYIDKEKVDPRDFIIPDIPFLSSSGTRRSIYAPVTNLEWNHTKDELNKNKQKVTLSFKLLKGCYATSLLREIMKSDSIRNY